MPQRIHTIFIFVLAAGFSAAHAEDESTAPSAKRFDAVVAPVLASRCMECHSGAKPKGGLDLSRRDAAFRGGESGAVISPDKPNDSLLWQYVRDAEMPPEHPLPDAERQILRDWIAAGAAWGSDPIDVFRTTTDRRAGYDWWSLQPLADVKPPAVKNAAWPVNDIDRFVLAKLEEQGLQPSPEANARTLIRRLYFDLLGLPPTPEELKLWTTRLTAPGHRRQVVGEARGEGDVRPDALPVGARLNDDAIATLVDHLLASPQYGERWGRHWLDVARFGESDGFERNEPRKNLWPYRDWVIDSLNDDMPYDEFVRMQLAGDISHPGRDGAAAVGFLVAGVHNTVIGSSERMKLLARQDELEEIAAAVGQTFLGLTVNCARCHDHKFDPIHTREYYGFIAALDGVQHGERDVAASDHSEERAKLQRQIDDAQRTLAAIDSAAREEILRQRRAKPQADAEADRPEPLASWEFDDDLRDGRGELHGTAHGGAKLVDGALVLDGRGAFVATVPLKHPLNEKTLEAWVLLDNLDQRGGGVVSVQSLDGATFDAIVYGEREPRRWMAGSDFFRRTQTFAGPEETDAAAQPVHLAVVYQQDGTITAYRNGQPYGKAYKTGFVPFEADKSQVVFGMRHAPAGSNKMLAGTILRANLYDRALDTEAVAASAGVATDFVSEKSILLRLTPEARRRREELKKQLSSALARRQVINNTGQQKIYTVSPRNPGEMRVHIRGDVTDYGDVVSPGGIHAVAGEGAEFDIAATAPDPQRRTKLAQWITHPTNPLPARVMVNRLWHYHFGTGIVETPNDFGFNGGRPSHPELLDWLAGELARDGYRLKALHRKIVMSATYRQASTMNERAFVKDAGNRLLWRYSPRRIEAEVLRDSMLKIAGALNTQSGGPGFEDVTITPNNGTTYYEPADREGAAFARRTVYRFTPRGGRSAVLDTFDCPDPSSAAPRRGVTTTPLQALSLLNNSFVLRMAEILAARVEKEVGDDRTAQMQRAWTLALGRSPDEEEISWSRDIVERHGLSTLCRALFNANEFVVIE